MRRPQNSEPSGRDEANVRAAGFAWKTHTAITDWTARVDTKAAIVLSISAAVLGFLVTLSGNGRVLANLAGWRLLVERAGLVAIVLGIMLAASVVLPKLRGRRARKQWKSNFIYFGHLRHWNASDLAKTLGSLSAGRELEVLAEQLVITSKISWYKHRSLQWAICSIMVGLLGIAAAVAWP